MDKTLQHRDFSTPVKGQYGSSIFSARLIASRFISSQIADEARLNNHKFEISEDDYAKLIMHHKVVTVEYARDGTAIDAAHNIPRGLQKHDVYLLEQ